MLTPGELITRIRIPGPPAGAGSAYVKVGRTAIDYALVSAAARVVLDDAGRCTDASLVLGAVRPLPTSVDWIAETLRGKAPSREVLQSVADRLRSDITPGADMRVSAEYLSDLTSVVACDALARATRRARGEETNA
jgi:carbon-monoxide dehydrogenase medium subunit